MLPGARGCGETSPSDLSQAEGVCGAQSRLGESELVQLPRCPLAEHLCMDGIGVDDVIRAAEDLLARPSPRGERP